MFGVFAINEILRYLGSPFPVSRTLCHPDLQQMILERTRPKIGLKWCASCGSFALSTISIVLSPADWYLNTFSFVIFLPDVSDNTINQHSPVEMQCNLLMSFHLMNPFPIRILFFPIINNHVSPKRSILRHPALLSVCVNDHRPTFISR